MTSRADSLTFEDLQKAKESGMADSVEKLRNIDNISGDIEESEIERISIIGDAAAAEIERLRAALANVQSDFKSECERRDEIIISTTKLWNDVEADNIKLRAENTRIRAALANSQSPCVYCSLPADEWAKCQSGFPGCDRADDAIGCQELGASLDNINLRAALAEVHLTINALYTERDKARAALAEAREVMQRIASLLPGGRDGLDDDHHVLISQLTMGDLRRAAKWLEANPAP